MEMLLSDSLKTIPPLNALFPLNTLWVMIMLLLFDVTAVPDNKLFPVFLKKMHSFQASCCFN